MPTVISGDTGVSQVQAGVVSTDDLGEASVTPSKMSQPLTLGTAKAATGTNVDFTGIPSWVKRITVMFSGVGTNGTSAIQIQIGNGGFTTTGYLGAGSNITTAVTTASMSTGFQLMNSNADTHLLSGSVVITLMGSGLYTEFGSISAGAAAANVRISSGSVSIGATLDRLRITTVNGTDTFDAGTINIMYEG